MPGSLYRCARCGGSLMRVPPASREWKYADWEWRHHPSANAVRDAFGCDDRDIEPIRNRPAERPAPRPKPAAFWEEVMAPGPAEPTEPIRRPHRGRKPTPGTPAARRQGCSCPRGARGKWLMAGCVIHGVG